MQEIMKHNLLHRNKLYLALLGLIVGMVMTFSQTVNAETIDSTNQSTISFTVDYDGGNPGLPGDGGDGNTGGNNNGGDTNGNGNTNNGNGGTTAQPNIPNNGQVIHYGNGQSNKGLLPQTGAVQGLTVSIIGIGLLFMLIFLYRRSQNKREGVA